MLGTVGFLTGWRGAARRRVKIFTGERVDQWLRPCFTDGSDQARSATGLFSVFSWARTAAAAAAAVGAVIGAVEQRGHTRRQAGRQATVHYYWVKLELSAGGEYHHHHHYQQLQHQDDFHRGGGLGSIVGYGWFFDGMARRGAETGQDFHG